MPAVLAQTKYGPMLVPPADKYVGRALLENGCYCPEEWNIWKEFIPLGGTCVDVGANLGAHTLTMAERVGAHGKVIAIEPQWEIYKMLCGTLALSPHKHVEAKMVACGIPDKMADPPTIAVPQLDTDIPNNFGGLPLGLKDGGIAHKHVALECMDDWYLPRLDFLKIDVEGMEIDVLRSAGNTVDRCQPVIVAECGNPTTTKFEHSEVLAWLGDRGYAIHVQACPLGPQFNNAGSFNFIALPPSMAQRPIESKWVKPLHIPVPA